jgi:hypothetical protein
VFVLLLCGLSSTLVTAAPPTQLAPLPTTRVTSQQPTLRWELPAHSVGYAMVRISLSRNAADTVLMVRSTGTEVELRSELPPGVYFWKVSVKVREGHRLRWHTSPWWELFVRGDGTSVDSAWGVVADFDGDGFADVVTHDEKGATGGAIGVTFGGGDLSAAPDQVIEDPLDDVPAPYEPPIAHPRAEAFGAAWEPVGDVNGDGYGDLLVGAPAVGEYGGRADVYLGGPEGLDPTPATVIYSTRAYLHLRIAPAVGDVNGDGYADIAVTTFDEPSGPGVLQIHHGGALGVDAVPADVIVLGQGLLYPAEAADWNGDGWNDLAVRMQPGGLRILWGDGTTLVPVGSALLESVTDVASATDLNGDGYADVVAGDSGYDQSRGRVQVFFGGSSGLSDAIAIEGTEPGARFGAEVTANGDLNLDGFDDLVVVALPGIDADFVAEARVFYGAPFFPGSPQLIPSPTGAAILPALRIPGDVNGQGAQADLVWYEVQDGASTGTLLLGSADGLDDQPAHVFPPPAR